MALLTEVGRGVALLQHIQRPRRGILDDLRQLSTAEGQRGIGVVQLVQPPHLYRVNTRTSEPK